MGQGRTGNGMGRTGRGYRGFLLCLVLAGVFCALTYWAVRITWPKTSYWYQLFWERQAFQHANTFLVWLGILLVLRALVRYWSAAKLLRDQGIQDRLVTPWHQRIKRAPEGEQGTSIIVEHKRDQGKALLECMRDAGYVSGDDFALKPEWRHMLLERVNRIGLYLQSTEAQNIGEMMDINRDLSALDAEELSGQFTFVRWIVYMMPVVGFLGTVWGISAAMQGISEALPMVKNLDEFIKSLGTATFALKVAFDTTLLALAYSAILTLAVTFASSQNDSYLSGVDTWVIDNVLSHVTEQNPIELTMSRGFRSLMGESRGEGLAGIKAAVETGMSMIRERTGRIAQGVAMLDGQLSEIRKSASAGTTQLEAVATAADKMAGTVESLASVVANLPEAAAQGSEQLARIRTAAAKIQDELEGLASAVSRLPDIAADGTKRLEGVGMAAARMERKVEELAGAVSRLPDVVDGLGSASTTLSEFVAKLAAVGAIAEDVKAGVRELQAITEHTAAVGQVRDALAADIVADDGSSRHLATVTAVTELKDAILGQFERASKESADQISDALQGVRDAHVLLNASMEQINASLQALGKNFLSLAEEIRKRGRTGT